MLEFEARTGKLSSRGHVILDIFENIAIRLSLELLLAGDPVYPTPGDQTVDSIAGAGNIQGQVFISYVREDSGNVDALRRMFEAAGMRVWRDTASLRPGEDWRASVRNAIAHQALVFIACFSRYSVALQNSYQNEELQLAIEQLRLRQPGDPWLIPVRFDDCDIPDIDLGVGRTLRSTQRADLFGPQRDLAASRLLAAVQRTLRYSDSSTAESVSSSTTAESTGVREHIKLEQLIVVAVDGPSGSGKSSASRGVSRALGFRYLDTGAMYRALTWWLISIGADTADAALVAAKAAEPMIEVSTDPVDPWIRVNGRDVSAAIRTPEVSAQVSAVARVPAVREHLIAQQRAIIAGANPGIVAEGRDTGTVVAREAALKVFLTADPLARARRRAAELAATVGESTASDTAIAETQAAQDRRDRLDAAQSQMAADAVYLDATDMTLAEVVEAITDLIIRIPAGTQRAGIR